MSYQTIYNLIKATLTGRPAGTKVQAENHEEVELALLDYIEEVKAISTDTAVRQGHAQATAMTNCTVSWDLAFADTNYSWIVQGFDAKGNPAEIMLISMTNSSVTIKTLVNATIYAIARPHPSQQQVVSTVREAHAQATAMINCTMDWNEAFSNTSYSYFLSGFDARGNPVEIYYVSRTAASITVKTLVDASVMAIANPI